MSPSLNQNGHTSISVTSQSDSECEAYSYSYSIRQIDKFVENVFCQMHLQNKGHMQYGIADGLVKVITGAFCLCCLYGLTSIHKQD